MVKIRAERDGTTLHHHAAPPERIRDGRVTRWWRVDAKPGTAVNLEVTQARWTHRAHPRQTRVVLLPAQQCLAVHRRDRLTGQRPG